ncbi:MAG: MBL fold metallo-hydrolase [Bacteroidales bacterium]
MIKFISLSSGSSGNSYYIGNEEVSFLIDAGIGARTIKKRLLEYDIAIESIDFIIVTHDHSDHIKHLLSVSERFKKPVVATELLFKSLEKHPHSRGGVKRFKKIIEKEIPFVFKEVSITAFEVPHDATETLGFFIDFMGERFTFVTDIGHFTPRVADFCKISNHIIIESNYDMKMLDSGSYPQFLIERIRGGRGHLSNFETSLAVQNFYHEGIRNIFLCHLSDNNNTPELAFEATKGALSELGVCIGEDLNLCCLPRKSHKCFLI